jgi:hypothetical protein
MKIYRGLMYLQGMLLYWPEFRSFEKQCKGEIIVGFIEVAPHIKFQMLQYCCNKPGSTSA